MDKLEIRLTPHEVRGGGRWTAVELFVNGEALTSRVTDFERSRGYEPFDGYDWISLDGMQPAPDRLTGKANRWPGGGEVVLLVCGSCREEGCWPIFVRVSVTENVVEWTEFRQPHRPEWSYSELRLTFDRWEYDEELRRAFGDFDG